MSGVFGAGDFISDTTIQTGAGAEAGAFVPEMWSNEVIAEYKNNLVLAQLVVNMNHVGVKGDTVNIPTPTRGAANAKAKETQVTTNVTQNNNTQVVIDRHFEYSVLIEDFANVQALGSMRQFYTDDAGFQLAKRVDWDLHLLGRSAPSATPAPGGDVPGVEYGDAVIGSDGVTLWDPTANTNAGNATALTDQGIRRLIRTLDDQDIPLSDRAFVLPPVEKESLLGIARFTEEAFTGERGRENSIRNGLVGDLYDNPVYVSTNCPFVLDAASSNDQRAGLYLHKDAWVLIMQLAIRSQIQNMIQYLATLFVSDTIYGVSEIREVNVQPFIVPA